MDLAPLEQNNSKFCMKVFGEPVITFHSSVLGWVGSSFTWQPLCQHMIACVSTWQSLCQHTEASVWAQDNLCVSMWLPPGMTQCCSPFQTTQILLVSAPTVALIHHGPAWVVKTNCIMDCMFCQYSPFLFNTALPNSTWHGHHTERSYIKILHR